MALALWKLLNSVLPLVGTEAAQRGCVSTLIITVDAHPVWQLLTSIASQCTHTGRLTSCERHNALQTGELGGVQPHLAEPRHDLLQGLDLRDDLVQPLRLCVVRVHSCYREEPSWYENGPAPLE